MPDLMLLRRVVETLPRFSYRFSTEAVLHAGIAEVLGAAAIAYEHEHVAGPQDRFDFLVRPGIVIEAKIKGSYGPALRQAARYAQREDVDAVVLVASRLWARQADVLTVDGKPVHIIHLKGAAF